MLVEEGQRWRKVAVEDLPVPPPNEDPLFDSPEDTVTQEDQKLISQYQETGN